MQYLRTTKCHVREDADTIKSHRHAYCSCAAAKATKALEQALPPEHHLFDCQLTPHLELLWLDGPQPFVKIYCWRRTVAERNAYIEQQRPEAFQRYLWLLTRTSALMSSWEACA